MAGRSLRIWLGVGLSAAMAMGCGASDEEIQMLAATVVAAQLAAVPTPTPLYFPTPLPTATPFPTPTPQPTATPIVFPPTPTAVSFPPTATPQPTATPISFPPTPTPITLPPVVDFNAIYLRSWAAVFWIETPVGRGTGWLLEPGLIVTNEHVVRFWSTVTVRQARNPAFTGTVLASDSVRDVALVQYDIDSVALLLIAFPFKLGTITPVHAASPLMALGYSGNIGVNADGTVGSVPANVGVMAGLITLAGSSKILNIVMDAPVDEGDSGGPVLDADGQLVGMVRAAFGTSTGRHIGTNYSVHVDEIRAALPALRAGRSR